MRDVLRKWTPREKYVKYQNFPTHFGLLLSLECSGEISRKSVESAYPINSLKVDVFLLKSYARFSLGMLLIPGTGNGEPGTGNGSLGTNVQRQPA